MAAGEKSLRVLVRGGFVAEASPRSMRTALQEVKEAGVSKDALDEAARSSAHEDSGVPEPQAMVGGRQADLVPPVVGRESEAVSSKVSPSTMIQAMNAARVLLEKLDDMRTQTTAMDDFILPIFSFIAPLP